MASPPMGKPIFQATLFLPAVTASGHRILFSPSLYSMRYKCHNYSEGTSEFYCYLCIV
jgi:hypothetical protein